MDVEHAQNIVAALNVKASEASDLYDTKQYFRTWAFSSLFSSDSHSFSVIAILTGVISESTLERMI